MSNITRMMVLGIDLCEFDPPTDGELRDEQVLVVFSSDFDRVTAERDALQCRLTTADERNDLAIDLLQRARAVIEGNGWTDLERDIAIFLTPAERDHQIPGTSGMRLNMLANQGE